MKKSIITIAQQSKISWHPLTASLYKSFIKCYDDDFIRNLVENYPNQHRCIAQVIFFIHDSTSVKKSKKNDINSKVNNYQIVAGVFNPWFEEGFIKDKASETIFICLSADVDMDKQVFKQKIAEFILADFFKAIGTANMRFIANSFFGLSSLTDEKGEKNLANQFFVALSGEKLTGENYAKFLSVTRIALYKQIQRLKSEEQLIFS